ncbi:lactate racemase domain-containing protein [Marispirochaeta sp.]|jgi:hypothetical protein|uniref:lactate racemase domain-containing protein n=1 Tax=Marispirochaeta sp. TaxID=2038653 RepID=UPI0029C91230|nr:lactate racemase domain-containing protein [Marispirochaeta sp.]
MQYDTSVIDGLIQDYTVPELKRITQVPKMKGIDNLRGELLTRLERCGLSGHISPGMRVAVAVGSRGIADISLIAKTVIDYLISKGAKPFVVPAMGSHGGATPDGQRSVLSGYGVTEETMGVPVDDSMDVVEIGEIASNVPCYIAKSAFESDGIVLCARVKPHTDFRGEHESGLLKMIGIGLGKHKGAIALHGRGFENMENSIKMAAKNALDHTKLLLGVAVVENEIHETCRISCVLPEDFFQVDKEELEISKNLIGGIPFDKIDILFLGEIGKEVSGNGFDPNIADRFTFRGKQYHAGPNPRYIIVSNLSEATHGNAAGVGTADFITKRVFEKIDFPSTYINCITARGPQGAKIPMVMQDDETAIRLCMMMCGKSVNNIRIVCMKNTMTSMELFVSPALIQECREGIIRNEEKLKIKEGYFTNL